jgi:hypothetical protein
MAVGVGHGSNSSEIDRLPSSKLVSYADIPQQKKSRQTMFGPV